MNVKIMRGIPGSGKSTYANKLYTEACQRGLRSVVVSADDFFVQNGVYQFDITKLGEAHKCCLNSFLKHVQNGTESVIVDNTNINLIDIAPYVAVGEAMGYDVEILQVNVDPQLAASRNIHQVPKNQVLDMYRRFTAIVLPLRWKRRNVQFFKEVQE